MGSTQTSRSILGNEEAVLLTFALRDLLVNHPTRFAQALFSTATPSLCDELEILVEISGHLRLEEENLDDKDMHDYILSTIHSLSGKGAIDDPHLPKRQKSTVKRSDLVKTPTRPRLAIIASARVLDDDGILAIRGEQLSRVKRLKPKKD